MSPPDTRTITIGSGNHYPSTASLENKACAWLLIPTGEPIGSPLRSRMVEHCIPGATNVAHFFPTYMGYVVTLLFECTA
jgi:hypothetical protein